MRFLAPPRRATRALYRTVSRDVLSYLPSCLWLMSFHNCGKGNRVCKNAHPDNEPGTQRAGASPPGSSLARPRLKALPLALSRSTSASRAWRPCSSQSCRRQCSAPGPRPSRPRARGRPWAGARPGSGLSSHVIESQLGCWWGGECGEGEREGRGRTDGLDGEARELVLGHGGCSIPDGGRAAGSQPKSELRGKGEPSFSRR